MFTRSERPSSSCYSLPQLNTFNRPFHSNIIGFDILSQFIESNNKPSGFPKYNIRKIDEEHYVIELAIAGYPKEELKISVENKILQISSDTIKKEDSEVYLHRGITKKKFKQEFRLTQDVEVERSELENGMLSIYLKRVIPEKLKRKIIDIS